MIVETTISTNFPEHINNALARRWTYSVINDDISKTTKIIFVVAEKTPTLNGIKLQEEFATVIHLPKSVIQFKTI